MVKGYMNCFCKTVIVCGISQFSGVSDLSGLIRIRSPLFRDSIEPSYYPSMAQYCRRNQFFWNNKVGSWCRILGLSNPHLLFPLHICFHHWLGWLDLASERLRCQISITHRGGHTIVTTMLFRPINQYCSMHLKNIPPSHEHLHKLQRTIIYLTRKSQ